MSKFLLYLLLNIFVNKICLSKLKMLYNKEIQKLKYAKINNKQKFLFYSFLMNNNFLYF